MYWIFNLENVINQTTADVFFILAMGVDIFMVYKGKMGKLGGKSRATNCEYICKNVHLEP